VSMERIAPLTLLCVTCHQPMERIDIVEQNDQGPRMEFYQCPAATCSGAKLAIIFELGGDLTATQQSYVEREVARRGSFFPADYMQGGGRGPRNW
jgi:hypothetical protein